jgi:phage terminase Nu1 subunit (DNA packaging protein)
MAAPATLKKLAKAVGVSERTLNTWVRRGCPRGPVKAIDAWKLENVLPRKGGPRSKRDATTDQTQQSLQHRVNQANAEKAEQDARWKRTKADQLERKLVPIEQVVREAAEIFIEVRAVLDSIPAAVTKEVPQQLRTRIYEIERNKIDAALHKLTAIHLVGSHPDGA